MSIQEFDGCHLISDFQDSDLLSGWKCSYHSDFKLLSLERIRFVGYDQRDGILRYLLYLKSTSRGIILQTDLQFGSIERILLILVGYCDPRFVNSRDLCSDTESDWQIFIDLELPSSKHLFRNLLYNRVIEILKLRCLFENILEISGRNLVILLTISQFRRYCNLFLLSDFHSLHSLVESFDHHSLSDNERKWLEWPLFSGFIVFGLLEARLDRGIEYGPVFQLPDIIDLYGISGLHCPSGIDLLIREFAFSGFRDRHCFLLRKKEKCKKKHDNDSGEYEKYVPGIPISCSWRIVLRIGRLIRK